MSFEQGHHARKLAVILHADVVGSTALVQENEVLAHQRIQHSFRQLSQVVADYGGVAHEIRGDALVAEFSRASDSVCAALAFQLANSIYNEELEDGIRPEIRIGISLGEVVIADSTLTGSGVVLAQRLEQLADPGGVVVQGTVSETVPVRLPFEFESLGEQNLKGFDQPVRAFSVRTKPGELVPDPELESAAQPEASILQESSEPSRPSIAVLPFDNMSGDSDQDYFSDGITEDIITEISRFRDLFVIARHSSFALKNQPVDIADIGEKLGVQYVVEGSVRKSGNRARITAQLIDVSTGNHIWADRYDRELEDIFDVLDEVVRTITTTLVGRIGHVHRDRAQRKSTSSLDAYDWFVQGRELFYNATSDDNVTACGMFENAISLDPDYAAAYALLAESYVRDWVTFWNNPPETSQSLAWENAKKAMMLDDTDSRSQTAIGVANLFDGNHEQGRFHLDKALVLNPNDTHALIYMSRHDVLSGNPDLAIERITEARRHNPFGKYDWSLVPAYYLARRYDEAINVMRGIQDPAPIQLCWVAATYAQAGEIENAGKIGARLIDAMSSKLTSVGATMPKSWLGFISQRYPFKERNDMEHFLDGLRKAGVPD
jgi:adenylate cyclase